MIVTCVHVKVKPENVREFIKAIVENHQGSVLEPGNLRFDVLQEESDPCRFMIYEAYVSEEAANLHKSTPHYINWRDAVKEYMAETRYGVRYNVVEPSDISQW